MDNPIVRFAIAGTDVIDIAEALKDVKKDLDDKT
jgi:Fe-S-cluster formation regulator IscX/YfhJ